MPDDVRGYAIGEDHLDPYGGAFGTTSGGRSFEPSKDESIHFSGSVTVGSRVRFGTNIGVEPYLTIGDGAVIASGSVVTRNVPENATVCANLRPLRSDA
jgi:maltose O-acetyltransferase